METRIQELRLIAKRHLFRIVPNILVKIAIAGSEWRRYEIELMRTLAPRNSIALDIGASWGLYTFILSQQATMVQAFEPNPGKAAYLRSLAIPNCIVHEVALSCRFGKAELVIPLKESACATIEANNPLLRMGGEDINRIEVSSRPLDSITLDYVVGFAKIDVEGHELSVLRGSANILSRDQPILFIEIERRHNTDHFDQVFSFLANLRYRAYAVSCKRIISFKHFNPERDQNTVEMSEGIKRGSYIYNFLFVPDSDLIALGKLRASGFEIIE